jgi:DNA-binding transcriptional LysR family regulator
MTSRPVDTRLLHAFVVVAREGNISRAAARLFLSQPAVSLQLKELQALLQLELFVRTSAGVALTRDGQALLPYAERALDQLGDVHAAAQRLAARVLGKLRIGTILDPEFTRLGAFLRELVSQAPDIRPELQHGMSGTSLARLLAGEIDVGYYIGDAAADAAALPGSRKRVALLSRPLTPFAYRVVAPPGWQPRVQGQDWPALVELPWILTPPDSVHARLLAATLEPLGLRQKGVALVDQEASMLALVRSGVGLALARDAVAMQASQSEGIAVADRVLLQTQLCFITRAGARRSPVVDAALAAIERAWRS